MKISLNQLKNYVDINVPVNELCDRMVLAGFEVEEIIDLSESLKNVVVGRIEKITPHPDSDHLQICMVNVGDEVQQIVTGAQNVFEGAYVPAALHDSYLPDGTHIKKGKLRGVLSVGMLCSGGELNLKDCDYKGAEVDGIMIMDDRYPAGTDMREVLDLFDYVIDFKITANRPDCNCILGVAKEISVVLGVPFKAPSTEYKTVGGDINDYIKVDVENYDLCPRYIGRFVKNLRIKESPRWLKHCLNASGMRPINNIVDITNFVMLETGQPMHAFNYDELTGKHIIVRNAKESESITTLDGKEHDLTPDMLVIADGEKPSCLAGIMGGIESEIEDDTKNLFLESAKFKRDNVRKTGRKLGIRTEASGRFERGVDVVNVSYAMDRALSLICELDAGDVVDGVLDRNQGLPEDKILTVTTESINALLGLCVPEDTMLSILNSLGLPTTLENGTLTCRVPSIRSDIEGRADLAEEVMRIYGYHHIKGTAIRGEITRGKLMPQRLLENRIKTVMIAGGAYEIMTYSFIGSKATAALNLPADDWRMQTVNILNPLGDEYSTMRTQLTTSMLSVLSTNYNRKIPSARLFEISKRFVAKELPLTEQPLELPTMSIGLYGENEDFFTLKGIIEQLMAELSATVTYTRSSEPYLHPGRQAYAMLGDTPVAVFGELHPETADNFSCAKRTYVAEIWLDKLQGIEKEKVIYKPLPKFPAVSRDFALLCDIDLPAGTIESTIRAAAGKLCEDVKLFDVYVGSQIPAGKKSIAYSATLRSKESTLTEEEIERVAQKIIKKLEEIGAELRK
ncbi:MAG: phenylalanine--tRNA ligase subunit beta [Acutalibacteraceae bacterium]|nr:phenylalanine--tRNA ligase subunit beta [Acutalibacteraceae bacterium]